MNSGPPDCTPAVEASLWLLSIFSQGPAFWAPSSDVQTAPLPTPVTLILFPAAPLPAYVINELLDHAVPLALVVLRPILAVLHQPDLIREAQDVRQLLEQVYAVALKSVISVQGPVRLPEHNKGFLLQGQMEEQKTTVVGVVGADTGWRIW